jgi:hypothetical protein
MQVDVCMCVSKAANGLWQPVSSACVAIGQWLQYLLHISGMAQHNRKHIADALALCDGTSVFGQCGQDQHKHLAHMMVNRMHAIRW